MIPPRFVRLAWLLWCGAWVLLVAFAVYPVSSRLTRAGSVALLGIVWLGALALFWKRKALRWTLLAVTAGIASFLALPGRSAIEPEVLRPAYLQGLRRYEGARYHWGGEAPSGIDCSGLIRRGLIDSLALHGLQTGDPAPVRQALALWWRDCTADDLGRGGRGLTVPVLETSSLNQLDHSRVLPGDLAVTRSGIHILAYLGDRQWIEADPSKGRVIMLAAPADNLWFDGPMNIVRWRILQP